MSVEAITDQIAADVLQPHSATVDGRSVTKRTIKDMKEALDVVAGAEATEAGKPGLGIRFQKFTPYYR